MSHRTISHTIEIDAPLEDVSKCLFDLNEWNEWNKWTLLATKDLKVAAKSGDPGILKACYEGNNQDWQTFDFVFGEIRNDSTANQKDRLLTWQGSVLGGCLFSGHHTIRLVTMGENKTKMIHTETFGGVLPAMRMGLPYNKLNRNYRLINEAFKAHVEAKLQQAPKK